MRKKSHLPRGENRKKGERKVRIQHQLRLLNRLEMQPSSTNNRNVGGNTVSAIAQEEGESPDQFIERSRNPGGKGTTHPVLVKDIKKER